MSVSCSLGWDSDEPRFGSRVETFGRGAVPRLARRVVAGGGHQLREDPLTMLVQRRRAHGRAHVDVGERAALDRIPAFRTALFDAPHTWTIMLRARS